MTNEQGAIFEALKANKLPSLPHILIEMLNACQSNTANYQHISEIISRDPAIAARIISLANSSFYSRGDQIHSLDRALLVLGTDTIKTTVITASVQQFFSGFNTAHTHYLKQFWRRSLSCALLAKALATLTSYQQPEQAYITGLLHNIGELVLETNFPEKFSQLIQNATHEDSSEAQELALFHTTHTDIGARLVDEWNLGTYASDAIRFHHTEVSSVLDAHHLVKLIFLSSQLSKNDALDEPASFEIAERLFGLSAALTREIVTQIQNEVITIAESLNIDISSSQTPDSDSNADKQKQIELAEHIRNIGLLQSASSHLTMPASLPLLFKAIQEASELLFGYKETQVLLLDPTEGALKYQTLPSADLDAADVTLSIVTQPARSLIAHSIANQRIIHSAHQTLYPDELPVIDQHFKKITQSRHLVSAPMINNGHVIGAVVMGTSSESPITPSTHQLLECFLSEAATACTKLKQDQQSAAQSLSQDELQLKLNEVVHEASNPLSIIRNYLEGLASKLGSEHEGQSDITILKEEIDRTGQIILRLRDLQDAPQDVAQGVDINQEILDLNTLFEGSLFLSHAINSQLSLDKKLQRQKGNRNYIRQILTNLIKNAVEAMNNGGDIHLKTSHKVNVNGRSFVEIIVKDQGPGIPDEMQSVLFQPIQTTKGQQHAGLGLSITKNLVTEMGGSISCRSSDAGTEMQILIPVRNTH